VSGPGKKSETDAALRKKEAAFGTLVDFYQELKGVHEGDVDQRPNHTADLYERFISICKELADQQYVSTDPDFHKIAGRVWSVEDRGSDWRRFALQVLVRELLPLAEELNGSGEEEQQRSSGFKVFISYRREDSAGHTGRVHDRLLQELGRDLLFLDVDAIPLGMNVVNVLREEIERCDVFLAVIGPRWIDACDQHGRRRLDNPADLVRIEVSSALRRDIPVIPILIDGAAMPSIDALPEDLQDLSFRAGLDVRHATFHADIDKLIRELKTRERSRKR
jgi:TIR domain